MNATSLILLFGALMAQAQSSLPPAKVHMVAVQALNEGRTEQYFGPGLDSVYKSLHGLDYDSFYRLRSADDSIPYGTEAKIAINDRYTLCLRPLSKDDQGRIRVQARIEMAPKQPGDAPINALSDTTLLMVPDKKINLGGLKLRDGDLIVVLWFEE